jgi:hypothetical protein
MKSRILSAALLLFAICYLPVAGFAQGSCSPDKIALLDTGRPANGAQIRVCPAGGTFPGCGSSLFTDPTLGTPLVGSPVVTSDSHGNWGFCAAAGQNYDYQVTCTGCTTATIKNFPLPPASPINAASLTSSSANPANVGQIKLASSDCMDWRNNANTGNIQLCKNTSDQLDLTAFSVVNAVSVAATGNVNAGGAVTGESTGDVAASRSATSGAAWLGTDGNLALFRSGLTALGIFTPAGTLTIPVVTDTLVARNTTETLNNKTLASPTSTGTDSGTEALTNKSLGGTGSTTPSTPFNRLAATRGTALTTAKVGTLTGWGTTATVSAVFGSDSFGIVAISSSGTGQAANPTFTITFSDGTWGTNGPMAVVCRADANSPSAAAFFNSSTPTTLVLGLQGTPAAGNIYTFIYFAAGR